MEPPQKKIMTTEPTFSDGLILNLALSENYSQNEYLSYTTGLNKI